LVEENRGDLQAFLDGYYDCVGSEQESFLKSKAIMMEKKNICRTYLAVDEEKRILGYFSIGLRCIKIPESDVGSKDFSKKMNVDPETKVAQSYLIGQLSRSRTSSKGLGSMLMADAIGLIRMANHIVGCRLVRVDCDDTMTEYYSRHGFRKLKKNGVGELNQMAYILRNDRRFREIVISTYARAGAMTGRSAKVERKTRETDISVELSIDGAGKFDVECDIQFLKHMVETLARYASFDIAMKATGDNDHHLIEDAAITIGKAMAQAMDGRPIERMATSTVVMDDAMVQVSLDLVDRPYADIDCPDPLYLHFMRSFAMTAGITLHVLVIRGFDDHHIVEASFKALGRALKEALKVADRELSTKDRPEVRVRDAG
jgi:imidazoleglycerol-phosphate dehydratase